MTVLPTGTVTFVFTDIEGSTAMLQRLGHDGFLTVLEDHNRLVRKAFDDGVEVRSEGDSFFYAFASAAEAVGAAVSAQYALEDYTWPEGGTVRVRVGLHTGDGTLGGGDYVGLDVHRAARIAASGHGGQVLLSVATKAASPNAAVRDLGSHRFKDIIKPESVYQVVASGLGADCPPIRSLDARPNNLPAQPSDFVGREREAREIADLLESARLVTLTGPGGTGKTRLAVHVATTVLGRFEHGVVYVPLDALREAQLVVPAIVAALGLDEDTMRSAVEVAAAYLAQRKTLLVLDNFEHVLAAARDVATLLATVPGLRVLITSQAVLRIRGEHIYAVPPLAAEEAVDLFARRAAAADPLFALDDSNRETVGSLVARLDGLPLAMELAAARVRLFGLTGLLDRVTQRLEIGGAYIDLPARHRTLQSAIEWSYDLLEDDEKAILRRLSVFDGGFALDGAEAVAGPSAIAGVASLMDKSLLRSSVTRGEARFAMLDSIRHFSLDGLTHAGEHAAATVSHAGYFADLAETARPLLERGGQRVWLDRLAAEHDNIRAVVRHSVDSGQPDYGLRATGAAWRYFHRRGHLPEARHLLTGLLDIPGASGAARAEGMDGLAGIVYWQGDYEEARELYEELLELFRALDEPERVADTLFALSTTTSFLGDLDRGAVYGDEARAAYEEAGVFDGVRRVVAAKALGTWQAGQLEDAPQLWTEAEDLFESAGDTAEQLQTQIAMAAVTHQLGRTDEAVERARSILEGMLEIGDVSGTIMVLDYLGAILAVDDPGASVATCRRHHPASGGPRWGPHTGGRGT